MYFGVGLSAGNKIKGRNLVSIVAKTTMAIVVICWVSVIKKYPFRRRFYAAFLLCRFFEKLKAKSIIIIEKTIKLSLPKITRHKSETKTPKTELK